MADRVENAADASTESHLEGFVHAFIEPSAQARWRHVLLESPAKARDHLHKFEHQRRENRTAAVSHLAWLALLQGKFAEVRGLFFDGHQPAAVLTGAEVLARLLPYAEDALWSVSVGAEAYFFMHDGQGWACRKEP